MGKLEKARTPGKAQREKRQSFLFVANPMPVPGYEAVLVISLTGRSAVHQVIKLYVEISRKNEYVAVRPPPERCMAN